MARTHYLDNLRIFLTALVTVHHSSVAYGGLGNWVYSSSHANHRPGASTVVLGFNALNQTFFMALFFLLSGYFSSISASRRTRSAFLKQKWRHLGVPTVVYSVVSRGLLNAILARVKDGEAWSVVGEGFWEGLKSIRGVRGPVWYYGLLLIFDGVYVVVRGGDFAGGKENASRSDGRDRRGKIEEETDDKEKPAKTHRPSSSPDPVTSLQALAAVALTTTLAFLIRLRYPANSPFRPLNLRLSYVPQYTLFYTFGVYAHRHLRVPLHKTITGNSGIRSLLFATIVSITGIGLYVLNTEVRTSGTNMVGLVQMCAGGWNPLALCYAAWNECLGVIISACLLHVFANRWVLSTPWTLGGVDLARYSYPAFLVHAPVTVFMQCWLDGWETGAVVKSLGVGALACLGSWSVGWGLVRVLERCGLRGYI